jgi:hypothetical protein
MNLRIEHPNFCRKILLHPDTRIMFADDFGLNTLKNARAVFIDGTFNTCEEDLILTVALAPQGRLLVPAAYLLSQERTTTTYLDFFETLDALTGHRMRPEFFCMDFEQALAKAALLKWPEASIWRDLFHLLQANLKKARSLGLSDKDIALIQKDLLALAECLTSILFQEKLDECLMAWTKISAEYVEYFQRVYLVDHAPETWAAFGRPVHAPSGTGAMESFNNRLQNVVLADRHNVAVDRLASLLKAEQAYWEYKVAQDRVQIGEEVSPEVPKKRRTLAHYLQSENAAKEDSVVCAICSISKKVAKGCGNKACIKCCNEKGLLSCKVHKHGSRVSQDVHKIVDECMGKKAAFWMKYAGGSRGTSWRFVTPVRWSKIYPNTFEAVCDIDKREKNFNWNKILDISIEKPQELVEEEPEDRIEPPATTTVLDLTQDLEEPEDPLLGMWDEDEDDNDDSGPSAERNSIWSFFFK